MLEVDFITRVPGKWTLTGEHAVVRDGRAIVFPLFSHELILQYKHDKKAFCIHQNFGEEYAASLQDFLTFALNKLGRKIPAFGTLSLENRIPIGVCLGSSAALCVAVAQWFMHQSWLAPTEYIDFATQLEDFFHGKSSGMDVAAVCADAGVIYHRRKSQPLLPVWQPRFGLSMTGAGCSTKACVAKVTQLGETDPLLAVKLDEAMQASVLLAEQALLSETVTRELKLISAMEQAAQCYEQWGLISPALTQAMRELKAAGALAVKPVGSGGGGSLLSLWPQESKLPQDVQGLSLTIAKEGESVGVAIS